MKSQDMSAIAPRKNRHTPKLILIPLLATLLPATAQNPEPPNTEGPNVFVGDTVRLALGTSGAGRVHGEIGGVLYETEKQAWLGELWLTNSAGGIKLSQHRLLKDTVHKLFVAHDQNATRDHKVTFGYGQEHRNWFGNVNLSIATTGRRLVGVQNASTETQEIGQTTAGNYVDTTTRTTQSRFFDRAFEHGMGLRAGRFSEAQSIRLSVGLDHEWGGERARQNTVSLLAEKYFEGTPHSVAMQLSYQNRSGDANSNNPHTTQALLTYRLSLSGVNYRPEKRFLVTPITPAPQVTAVPAKSTTQGALTASATTKEKRWVKTKVTMNSDALFDFNSIKLTRASQIELDRIATTLRQEGYEGKIRITGHTCNIGSDKVNDRISKQRAEAVRNYLTSTGAVPTDATVMAGKGKREPKHPDTESTRAKNRRVELEFFSFTNKEELIEIPQPSVQPMTATVAAPAPAPVVYERTLIDQPPAWSQRALRTTAQHKREVDIYRIKEEHTTETKTRQWTNTPPVAQEDTYQLSAGKTATLAVMVNDSDPDNGDALTLLSVTSANKGQVRISGQNIIYTADPDFEGRDVFSYAIKDSRGLTSTAKVSVILTKENRAPMASNDSFKVSGRTASTLDVLGNDTDPDNDPLKITSTTQTATGVGRVEISGNQLRFTPFGMFVEDTFQYTITDSKGGTSSATVLLIDP